MSTLPDPEGRKLLRVEVRNAQTPIENKPEWIRTTARAGENYQDMRSLARGAGLRRSWMPEHLRMLGRP